MVIYIFRKVEGEEYNICRLINKKAFPYHIHYRNECDCVFPTLPYIFKLSDEYVTQILETSFEMIPHMVVQTPPIIVGVFGVIFQTNGVDGGGGATNNL